MLSSFSTQSKLSLDSDLNIIDKRYFIYIYTHHMEAQECPEVNVQFNFIKDHYTHYGLGLFLVGSIDVLGGWEPTKAIRMECKDDRFWTTTIKIPVNTMIEYKFFVTSFTFGEKKENSDEISWLGNRNESVYVPHKHKQRFQKDAFMRLKVMSFNLRYENPHDKGETNWQNRKEKKCIDLILDEFPDLLGVQEPIQTQIDYLIERTRHLYSYFGKPRDLNLSQHSGIFVRKDRFIVREDDYTWINKNKTPGKRGFGAHFSRYFTCLVLQSFHSKNTWITIVNTHLDNESQKSRAQGVKMISSALKQKQEWYGNVLKDMLVTGDFNTSDFDPIFQEMKVDGHILPSLRKILPKEQTDTGSTFNGFVPITGILKQNKDVMAIDHIFVGLSKLRPTAFKVIRDPLVSDHYPIIGQFQQQLS